MDYITKTKEILSNNLNLPVEQITDDAKLTSLEQLDSLTFEKIVLSIEKFLGHKVDAVNLLELRSVKDVAHLLQKESAMKK